MSADFPSRLAAILAEAAELESAARTAAQNGMFESGANLRNRAAGIRRALEVLVPNEPPAESDA